jgi:hypothetical protein
MPQVKGLKELNVAGRQPHNRAGRAEPLTSSDVPARLSPLCSAVPRSTLFITRLIAHSYNIS